jgi:2-polyprenyl-3-methyl-5-hydroxy-6-metoxy-1,4-benzoquinol methylase
MNVRGKTVDKTYLSIDQAENRGFIHRDYIAHCFRWSHIAKHMMKGARYKEARVLDIGCGREIPFGKLLYSSKMVPKQYDAVDAGPLNPEDVEALKKGKMGEISHLYPNYCFSSSWPVANYYTDIVCLECAEHVEPAMLKDMLAGMRDSLVKGYGRLWISTPCWDYVSCAANHVNEMTYAAFGAMLSDAGFYIENVSGTFASISDYKHKMSPAYLEVFNDLRDYYDSNVLSTIFAPMFPAQSRNCLWECSVSVTKTRTWKDFADIQQPWGSSSKWREMPLVPLAETIGE